MNAQEREKLRQQIVRHEGLRFRPYKCTAGKLTIGVGRNLEDTGISEEEAFYLLDNDLTRCIRDLKTTYAWFNDLNDMRQRVWVDLMFNLGPERLALFRDALAAMNVGDYERAAAELMDSKWSRQVGKRSTWLCKALETGIEPKDAA